MPSRRLRIGIGLAAGVALLAALPWLVGLAAERAYRNTLADLVARGYRIVQDEYRLGWVSSRALTVIAPGADEPGAAIPPQVQIASRIRHGPRAATLWHWPPVLATATSRLTVVDAPRPLPPLLIDTALDVAGGLTADLGLPDVTYSGSAGQLHLIDGKARVRTNAGWTRMSGEALLARLTATDAAGRGLVVDGVGARFALRIGADGLPLGAADAHLDAVVVGADAAAPALDAGGFRLTLDAERAGEALDLHAAAAVERLLVQGRPLAPSRAQAALSGLDAAALAALWQGQRELTARQLPGALYGLALGALLLERLPTVLGRGPALAIDPVELATPEGPVSASLTLRLPAGGDLTGANLTPAFWLARLAGEGEVQLPEPIVLDWLTEQQRQRVRSELAERGEGPELPPALEAEVADAAEAALRGLIRERWLVPSGGRLGASLVLGDGLLTVNGRTIPVAAPP